MNDDTTVFMYTGDLINVRKYKFNRQSVNPTFRVQCYRFFFYLLDDLKSKLLALTVDQFDEIRAPRSPTLSFPIEPHSHELYDRFPSYILPLTKNQWENNIRTYFASEPIDEIRHEFATQLEAVRTNDTLCLKYSGRYFLAARLAQILYVNLFKSVRTRLKTSAL